MGKSQFYFFPCKYQAHFYFLACHVGMSNTKATAIYSIQKYRKTEISILKEPATTFYLSFILELICKMFFSEDNDKESNKNKAVSTTLGADQPTQPSADIWWFHKTHPEQFNTKCNYHHPKPVGSNVKKSLALGKSSSYFSYITLRGAG